MEGFPWITSDSSAPSQLDPRSPRWSVFSQTILAEFLEDGQFGKAAPLSSPIPCLRARANQEVTAVTMFVYR